MIFLYVIYLTDGRKWEANGKNMDIDDLGYVAHLIADMAMVPARIWHSGEKILLAAPVPLPADPADRIEERIEAFEGDVGYIESESYALYGLVRTEGMLLVVGPFLDRRPSELEAERLGIALGILPEHMPEFVQSVLSFGIMPRETTLLMICALGFAATGRHLTVEDLAVQRSSQDALDHELAEEEFGRNSFRPDYSTHSSRQVERVLASFIRQGRPQELRSYLQSIPTFRAGTLSESYLHHSKNLLITEATLASRAAMEGGLDEDEALGLSDAYINRCESMQSTDDISNLGWHMLLDYAERVEKLRIGETPSRLAMGVSSYVHAHIFESIKTEDVAAALQVSRGFLSTQFKRECGIALSSYIQKEKIDEAKRLLEDTSQPISSISTYLGFCSQSHFNSVFRKLCGMTPGQWRRKAG